MSDEGKVRLSKRMSELGLCSRREADEMIEKGWVYVDGKQISQLGHRILPDQKIELNQSGKAVQEQRVTVLLNKPVGFVSGQPEPGFEPAITLIVPPQQYQSKRAGSTPQPKWRREHLKNLAPAGRLDIDSTGLLVMTQDGRIAKQLIGEDSPVDKEYLVRVEGNLSERGMELLNHGLELDGVQLKPASVVWQNQDQLRFTLREGRHRQIRRMCELVGLEVVALKRIRIGKVRLGEMALGEWRYLRPDESFV